MKYKNKLLVSWTNITSCKILLLRCPYHNSFQNYSISQGDPSASMSQTNLTLLLLSTKSVKVCSATIVNCSRWKRKSNKFYNGKLSIKRKRPALIWRKRLTLLSLNLSKFGPNLMPLMIKFPSWRKSGSRRISKFHILWRYWRKRSPQGLIRS